MAQLSGGREGRRDGGAAWPHARGPEADERRRIASRLRLEDVPRPVLAAIVVLMVLACLAGVLLWREASSGVRIARSGAGATSEASPAASSTHDTGGPGQQASPAIEESATIVVDVDGAVASPGVYRLEQGDRVQDAVASAGGLAEDADTTQVNLAAELADGQKVLIPRQGEQLSATASGATAETTGGLVNLNTADVALLDTLPGVGEATAQAIVDDREANGPFASPEDLMRVSGIGEKKYAKLKSLICV